MTKRLKVVIIVSAAVLLAGTGVFLFRGKLFPSAASATASNNAAAVSTVAAARGDITSTVSASGQLEPNTIITIRPDSNMPTRKITKILVSTGQHVAVNQAIAQIDATGLDLSLQSAEANYQGQLAKLENLKAKPADMDLAAAEASLTSAWVAMESAKTNYDGAKVLTDKGLASKSSLAEYERALSSANAAYESEKLSYQNVKAISAVADIKAQESVAAGADYTRKMAEIILESTLIRTPSAGVVAEILVGIGDLVSPSTSIAYIVDTNSMLLVAFVNENDTPLVKMGQTATMTQAAYPDEQFSGVVKSIDLHASISNNVSTFAATIEVPNKDGKLLWGMNADALIEVVSLKNVLTLPASAIKTSNGRSMVTVAVDGRLIPVAVEVGATDGSKTQILAGLTEGDQVVSKSGKTTVNTATTAARGGMEGIGGLLGGGPGGPPPGGP